MPHSRIDRFFRFLKSGLQKHLPRVYKLLSRLWHQYKALRNKLRFEAVKKMVYPEVTSEPENQFIAYKNNEPISPIVKLIAFYLPQFHPFPENDKWWGKGFTEWTNVTKAKPNIKGHYQPHRPIHFGYYDLRVPEVMEEQARLAKAYGIYGFSYYFYWFNGKVLMEKPLRLILENKAVEMPFCLTWANENWTRRWDGNDKEILIAQNYSKEDARALFQYLLPYFKDERYICIEGKPVFIVYRPNDIPKISEIADLWREEALQHGLPGIYLISVKFYNSSTPQEIGFDALVEFPPHKLNWVGMSDIQLENPNFTGHVLDYHKTVEKTVFEEKPDYKLFQTVMLSWDNTARRQNAAHIFHNFNIPRYQQWLSYIANSTYKNKNHSEDEKLIFINAWNEWAEGTHLEPDEKFGYAYLQATYDILKDYDRAMLSKVNLGQPQRKSDYAIILHLFFDDVWSNIYQYLSSLTNLKFDLYVTVCSVAHGLKVKEQFPDAYIELVENRGRDILPFIRTLSVVAPLKYRAICKIHSKKSTYRTDGTVIRKKMLDALIGNNAIVTEIVTSFERNPKLGMLIPKQQVLTHKEYMGANLSNINLLSTLLKLKFKSGIFPAGSMFWFKPEALISLVDIPDRLFAMEEGGIDGKMEHAVERILCSIVEKQNYCIATC